ncbi:MAG TPA: TlpA disulfide reductase family protein [Pyrinomonadaceae bacterium]|nr:TlpA disulfide reductase family protein [Pyrinomonadaceae bacterium]
MKTLKNLFLVSSLVFVCAFGVSAQSMQSLSGGAVDIEKQRGKVVILAVGAKWLPLSGKQAEYTNALAKKYAGRNVAVYFVATDSLTKARNMASNDDLAKFGTTNKLSVPILRDPDGAFTLRRYSLDQIPAFVILDKNGQMSGEAFGGIDPKFDVTVPISKAVDRLL